MNQYNLALRLGYSKDWLVQKLLSLTVKKAESSISGDHDVRKR